MAGGSSDVGREGRIVTGYKDERRGEFDLKVRRLLEWEMSL